MKIIQLALQITTNNDLQLALQKNTTSIIRLRKRDLQMFRKIKRNKKKI